jgi:hypothetical protein
LQSDYFWGPNHNSTSKKLFFKIPPLNLEEQPRQTFEFSGSCFPFRHFQIGETFNKPFCDEQLKPLANLSTTLTSSLPTDLFGQNLAQSRNNNYDTDTRF